MFFFPKKKKVGGGEKIFQKILVDVKTLHINLLRHFCRKGQLNMPSSLTHKKGVNSNHVVGFPAGLWLILKLTELKKPIVKCLFGRLESKLILPCHGYFFFKKMTDWSCRRRESPPILGIRGCSFWFVIVTVVFHVLLGISGRVWECGG